MKSGKDAMNSDDELDKLVAALVVKSRAADAATTTRAKGKTNAAHSTATTSSTSVTAAAAAAAAGGNVSVGDEELDLLIHEALVGGPSTISSTPQGHWESDSNRVLASLRSGGTGSNGDDDNCGSSETMALSNFGRGGMTLQEDPSKPEFNGRTAIQPLRQCTTTCQERDMEEDLLLGTLAQLADPPKRFVSRCGGTDFTPQEPQSHQQQVSSSSPPPPLSSSPLATATAEAEARIGGGGGISVRSAPADGSKGGGMSPHARSSSEEILRKTLDGENPAVAAAAAAAPAVRHDLSVESVPSKRASLPHEMGDEKRILDAILTAVRDHQSSVSGDLVCEEDGCNVEAVLQRAEEVAASSLRESSGRGNRITHLHEHIEMREELRRARGSVGWPSCVCVRATPFTMEEAAAAATTFSSSSASPVPPPSLFYSWSRRPMLCIGTTLGIVLLFDSKRKMCGICGSVSSAAVEARGAVVSLSIFSDAPMVLSGHEQGVIILWDTNTLTVLREIAEEYSTPITRFCHCQMDPLRTIVLSSDGSVKLLSFTRIMSKMVYRLTNVANSAAETPFNDVDIFFLKGEELYVTGAVSSDILLVSALDCGFQSVATPILRRTRIPNSAQGCQLLRFVFVPHEDRVLMCVAWGTDVDVFTVAAGGVLSELQRVSGVRLERPVHAMASISGCCLVLDQSDILHLLNVGIAVVLETRALHGVEPVFFSSRSCGTRYNAALADSGTDVVIMGRQRVFTCTLLSWKDRLDALVEQKRYVEALELARAFALEVALGVVGLYGDAAARRASICSYLTGLIKTFLSDIIQSTSSHVDIMERITCVIGLCSEVDAMDVFFGPTMQYLRSATGDDTLALYGLEACILSGTVTSLPEVYIQPLFDLLVVESSSKPVRTPPPIDDDDDDDGGGGDLVVSPLHGMVRAERALMRLDGCNELLLHLAKRHSLVRLAVTVLSYRECRYDDALQFALAKRDHHEGEDPNDDMAVCFFECTMRGYTVMEETKLPEQQRCVAWRQLWSHLTTVTKDLEAILHRDPERILRAALSSLQEEGPYSPWTDAVTRLQCITQLFVQLVGMEPSSSNTLRPWELARREWPPYAVVHQLFTGVMQLILSGVVVLTDLQSFCEHACSHLIYQFQTSEDEAERRSVQNNVTALFSNPVTSAVDFAFAEEELHQQRMFRALAALHCSRLEYLEAIDCHLDREGRRVDPDLAQDVFRVLRDEMNRALHSCDENAVQHLRDAVMHRISPLVSINATLLAQFVFDYLPGNHEDIMNILCNSTETFLRYLDELVAKGDPVVASDAKLQNTYIDLMCVHNPERVYPYLNSHDSVITYDLHHALQAVRRHKVPDAAVFLLEKTLMVDEAMEILIDAVVKKLQDLRSEVINHVITACDTNHSTLPLEQVPLPFSYILQEQQQQQHHHQTSLLSCAAKGWRGVEMETRGEGEEMSGGVWQHSNDDDNNVPVWVGEELLQHVLGVGIDLCSKYNDSHDSRTSGRWFSLLGLFTIPRRFLCHRQGEHNAALQSESAPVDGFDDDEIHAALALDNPSSGKRFPLLSNPLSTRGVMFLELMITLYTKYASYLLMHMIKVLDLSKVVDRIVEDYERERFGPLKPVIVDIMSSLSFDLEVNRLCQLCIEEDVIALAYKLHRGFNRGVVPLSDTCYICGRILGDVWGAAEAEKSVRIYACGHGFHESCALRLGKGLECAQCHKERMGDTEGFAAPDSKMRGDADTCRSEDEFVMQDDLPMFLRRLRHTRAKLDGARGYWDLLSGFLSPSGVPVNSSGFLKESMGKQLLAPPRPPPIHLGGFSLEGSELNLDTALTAALTDEELLELFGTMEEGEGCIEVTNDVFSPVDGAEFGF